MTPINLCFFTDSLEPSGVGTHLALLIEGLDPQRYRTTLVCPPTPGAHALITRAEAAGARYQPLTVRNATDTADYQALVALLRDTPVQVFHNQIGIAWEGHWGTWAAREAGVPVVISTEHLPYVLPIDHNTELKATVNYLVDRIITVCAEARQSHLAAGIARPDQIVTIPNGIDVRAFTTASEHAIATLRQDLGFAPGAPIVGTVARMTEQKGHCYLLDAWPAVRAAVPEATLVLVGDGPLRWELEQQGQALGVADSVRFLGTREDVPALLGLFNVAVLPSLFEGLPLYVLEAMAAGRPVVGTAVCGASEAIAEGETGLLVPPRDPAALAGAVISLLQAPTKAERMGQAGRLRLLRHFQSRRMVADTCALYDTLLTHPAPTRPVAHPLAAQGYAVL
jgi:glycosyltransferase involved in cell wall biosynthesis